MTDDGKTTSGGDGPRRPVNRVEAFEERKSEFLARLGELAAGIRDAEKRGDAAEIARLTEAQRVLHRDWRG